MTPHPRVVLVTLGGTIAMVDRGGGLEPTSDGAFQRWCRENLLPDVVVEVREHASVPSVHLDLGDVVAVAGIVREAFASGASGVVVVQGTDTLEETAYALQVLLGRGRTVVVTGAMRPLEQPGADGPANLRAAVAVAADPGSARRGVLVVMNDEIHLARSVSKTHVCRTNSFVSSEPGPVGGILEGQVRWWTPQPVTTSRPAAEPAHIRRVPVVTTWLGDDGQALRAVLTTNPDALVIEGLGAGHVPPPLVPVLKEAAARIPVVLTAAPRGAPPTATYGYVGSERDLLDSGVRSGGGLSARKARVRLALGASVEGCRDEC